MDGWVWMTGWGGMALGMALAGALHCAGMCGGFAVLARGGTRFALYGAGKTLTYVLLGTVVGSAGALVSTWSLGSRVLAVFVGLLMMAGGLQLGGWFAVGRWFGEAQAWSFLARASDYVSDGIRTLIGQRNPLALVGLGMMNGLLPCGLLYAALAAAAGTGGWWQGGAFMAVFGLGTLPALGLAAWLASRLGPRRRVLAARIGGVLLILFGLFTLFRGFPAMPDHAMH